MCIDKAIKMIKDAEAILICAGAGMGVDSGLPDFRGNEGFWKAYPPYRSLGLQFTEMANPSWFINNPEFAWGFYGHRLNLYRSTIPHKGFEILLNWAKQKKNYFVFTSNVDGQFQKAGFSDNKIVECHGSIHYLQCSQACNKKIWPGDKIEIIIADKTMLTEGDLPLCSNCGNVARPNILMFGDWYWESNRTEDQYERMDKWLSIKQKIIIIELGAGMAVPTVRNMSENFVKKYNAGLIRINIREPEVPDGQIGIDKGALETLEIINSILYSKH